MIIKWERSSKEFYSNFGDASLALIGNLLKEFLIKAEKARAGTLHLSKKDRKDIDYIISIANEYWELEDYVFSSKERIKLREIRSR